MANNSKQAQRDLVSSQFQGQVQAVVYFNHHETLFYTILNILMHQNMIMGLYFIKTNFKLLEH